MKRFNLFWAATTSLLLLGQTAADSLDSTQVCPGVMYYHEVRAAGPWNLYLLKIDMTNPSLKIETVKADNCVFGNERTTAMAARNSFKNHRVVGAINGDFYEEGGIPTNAQVSQGIMLQCPNDNSIIQNLVLGFSTDKNIFIGIVNFTGQVFTKSGSKIKIDGVNETRATNDLVVFNKFYGDSTGTNYWGTEITTRYLTDPIVNDTLILLVTAKDSIMASGHGCNAIPSNGLVLSGHGTAAGYLNRHCFVGDTLKIILQLPPFNRPTKEVIGGGPRLLTNGIPDIPTTEFCTKRHPRTAIGYDRDSTTIFFVVVDGRQPDFSVGMSLAELADYMLEWGIYQAMNLDGGGSSTIAVNSEIKNRPSDRTGERAVGNALLLIDTNSK